MNPHCQDIRCLKDTDELVEYSVRPGSWVCVKLCHSCAQKRRLAWLQQNRPEPLELLAVK